MNKCYVSGMLAIPVFSLFVCQVFQLLNLMFDFDETLIGRKLLILRGQICI